MALKSGFFDSIEGDRTYSADDMSTVYEGILTNGVVPNIGGGLYVSAGSGMNVLVAAGKCIIANKWMKNTGNYELSIDAADSSMPRIDMIVAELDESNRVVQLKSVKGEAAMQPTAPELSETQIALAEVMVVANATSIQDANITDVRVFTQIISGGSICTKWKIWQAYFFNENGKSNAVQMHDSGAIVWDANTNGVHSLMIELVINMSAEDGRSHTYGDKAMIALPDEYKDLEYSHVVYTGYILDSNGNMHSELYDSTGITRRLVVTKLKDGRVYIYVDPTLPPEYGSHGLPTQYAHQVVFYATVTATETWQERTY